MMFFGDRLPAGAVERRSQRGATTRSSGDLGSSARKLLGLAIARTHAPGIYGL